MNKNKNLQKANKAKNDEFYTQISDIENELSRYKNYFKDKIIFCNCDDPKDSNFWRYFALNFKFFGLKKLVSTHFVPRKKNTVKKYGLASTCLEKQIPSYKLEIVKNIAKEKTINEKSIAKHTIRTPLKGNGDFRSLECIEILKEADIVITNPPFSLFREYVAQLIEHKKKFIIIGNQNAITYKEIFNLIKDNKIWYGHSIHSGDREFRVPKHYPLNAASSRIDKNGNKFIRIKGVRWFTNINIKKRYEDLILYKKYNSKEYPKYDNYDAINIDKTKDIPMDYDGAMGVPITFMDKYNPEQFEIIGQMATTKITYLNYGYPYIDGNKKYARIIIKKRGNKNENRT